MWNLKRNDTNVLTCKTERDSQAWRTNLGLLGVRKGERNSQGVWDVHVHTAIFKMDNHKDLLHSTWNSAQSDVIAWVRGEFRREGIHLYLWLSPFAVHLKLSQHCLLTGYTPEKNKSLNNLKKRKKSCIKSLAVSEFQGEIDTAEVVKRKSDFAITPCLYHSSKG